MQLKIVSKEAFSYDLDEFKLYAKIDNNIEDALLNSFLNSAFELAETKTNRAYSKTTYEYYTSKQTDELPRAPFIDIVSVEKKSGDTYIAYSDYEIDTKDTLAKISFAEAGEYKVTFEAGYIDIPEKVKLWAYTQAATLYEYRTEFDNSNLQKIDNPFVDTLLDDYKVRSFV